MDESRYHVDFESRVGMTFQRLTNCPEFINFPKPPTNVCFVQMGGNDLCKRPPGKVITDILSYAKFLHDGVWVQHVIVGQLLRRQPWSTKRGYNDDVVTLKEEMASLENIHFCLHRCFWSDLSYLGRDVVHINGS